MTRKFFHPSIIITLLFLFACIQTSSAAVTANFTGTPVSSATYPVSVTFTDSSVCDPNCTNWAWDVDSDGEIESLAQNPTYSYTSPGNYSIRLLASNGINSGTKIRLYYIKISGGYVPTPIPQPTSGWSAPYHNGSVSFSYQMPSSPDVQNGTFMKQWLPNFTATGNFSIYAFGASIMQPVMNVFGFWIFVIIWLLYLFAVWIRTQDITIPFITGVLSLGIWVLVFPKDVVPVVIMFLVVCGAIIIYRVVRE